MHGNKLARLGMSHSDGQLYTSPWPGCSTWLIPSNAHLGIARGIFVDVVNICNQLTLSKGAYPPGLWVGLIQSIERAWEQNWDFSEDKEILPQDWVSSLLTCPANLRLASPYRHASQFLEINCMYKLYTYICMCVLYIYMYTCVYYIYTYICMYYIFMCVCVYIYGESERYRYGIGIDKPQV